MRRDFDALYLRNYVRGAENYGGRMIRWSKSNERIFALVGWSKGKFPHSVEGASCRHPRRCFLRPGDGSQGAALTSSRSGGDAARKETAGRPRSAARAAGHGGKLKGDSSLSCRTLGSRPRRETRKRFVIELQNARQHTGLLSVTWCGQSGCRRTPPLGAT